ncbi:MAG: endolytic transglycosylase MltG [Alphaproteobacteria bacterium]
MTMSDKKKNPPSKKTLAKKTLAKKTTSTKKTSANKNTPAETPTSNAVKKKSTANSAPTKKSEKTARNGSETNKKSTIAAKSKPNQTNNKKENTAKQSASQASPRRNGTSTPAAAVKFLPHLYQRLKNHHFFPTIRKTAPATLLLLLFLGIFLAIPWRIYTGSGPLNQDRPLVVKKGETLETLASRLKQEGIISSQSLFLYILQTRHIDRRLKPGEYALPRMVSLKKLADIFEEGKTIIRRFSVPEGMTVKEVVEKMAKESAFSGSLSNIPEEGFIFPDTWLFSYGDDRQELIDRMTATMEKKLEEWWNNRAPGLPYKNKEEALILASIIERETGRKDERPRVAGVFINRLRLNMKLQSDPTVIYAVSNGYSRLPRPITKDDLRLASPYNTYHITGLPPQPIANPGEASIKAALQPEAHDYLFFVADGTGGHHFSKSLQEHNDNVSVWRKIEQKKKK